MSSYGKKNTYNLKYQLLFTFEALFVGTLDIGSGNITAYIQMKNPL